MRKGMILRQLVLAACVAAFAGLSTSAAEQEDLLVRMSSANSIDVLQPKYGISCVDYERYSADRSVEKTHVYLDTERYIKDCAGDVVADKGGEVYGYNLEEGTAYRCLFLDGAYKDFKEDECLVPWGNYEKEDIRTKSVEPVDGTYSKVMVEIDPLPYATWLDQYGYTAEAGDSIRYEFTVENASAEITGTQSYYVKADGTESLFEQGITVLGDSREPEEPNMEMREWIFSDDCRAMTVIVDAGTVNERTYTQTAGWGCQITVMCPESYGSDMNLYDDAAYTQIHKTGADETQRDVTVYVRVAGGSTGTAAQSVPQQSTSQQETSAQSSAAQSENAGNNNEHQGMKQCPVCGKWFSTAEINGDPSEYAQHEIDEVEMSWVHDSEGMKQCLICGLWFSTAEIDGQPSEYDLHQIDEQANSGEPETQAPEMVQCEFCGGWFEAGNVFRNHVCPARDAAYAQNNQADGQVSSGEPEAQAPEMVQCEFCGGWFEAGSVFRNHVCPARDEAYAQN